MVKVYKTMQGKEIDMDRLMVKNELMPAIGNAGVNARGDMIGSGGEIVKKREELMSDYYEPVRKTIQQEAQTPMADYNEKPAKRNK